MINFIILASMKGKFVSQSGSFYDNFQMMGYIVASDSTEAVSRFFDQTPYPIEWSDVEYLWAEPLTGGPETGHYGEYERIYIETLKNMHRK